MNSKIGRLADLKIVIPIGVKSSTGWFEPHTVTPHGVAQNLQVWWGCSWRHTATLQIMLRSHPLIHSSINSFTRNSHAYRIICVLVYEVNGLHAGKWGPRESQTVPSNPLLHDLILRTIYARIIHFCCYCMRFY